MRLTPLRVARRRPGAVAARWPADRPGRAGAGPRRGDAGSGRDQRLPSPAEPAPSGEEPEPTPAEEAAAPRDPLEIYADLNLFGEIFDRIRAEYVDPPDEQELIRAAIQGMLTSLDPHSGYLPPADYDDMREDTSGEFGGLGIEVTMEEGVIKVVSPIDDTPAAKAGIMANDFIVELDGVQVQGLTLDDAVAKMRGPIGTSIKVTVFREGVDEPLDFRADPRRHRHARRALDHGRRRGRRRRRRRRAAPQPLLRTGLCRHRKGHQGHLCRPRRRGAQGHHPRPAQQSRRPRRPVGLCRRRLPQAGRRRADPRPHRRGKRPLRRPARRARRPDRRRAAGGADQWRLGLGLRNRRRRAAGPQARHRWWAPAPSARAACSRSSRWGPMAPCG